MNIKVKNIINNQPRGMVVAIINYPSCLTVEFN
jgi:hypothetical protein